MSAASIGVSDAILRFMVGGSFGSALPLILSEERLRGRFGGSGRCRTMKRFFRHMVLQAVSSVVNLCQ